MTTPEFNVNAFTGDGDQLVELGEGGPIWHKDTVFTKIDDGYKASAEGVGELNLPHPAEGEVPDSLYAAVQQQLDAPQDGPQQDAPADDAPAQTEALAEPDPPKKASRRKPSKP